MDTKNVDSAKFIAKKSDSDETKRERWLSELISNKKTRYFMNENSFHHFIERNISLWKESKCSFFSINHVCSKKKSQKFKTHIYHFVHSYLSKITMKKVVVVQITFQLSSELNTSKRKKKQNQISDFHKLKIQIEIKLNTNETTIKKINQNACCKCVDGIHRLTAFTVFGMF